MPKCRLACIDPKVDVRSTRAKRFDDLYVSAIDGPHERRHPLVVEYVRISPFREKTLYRAQVTTLRGVMERELYLLYDNDSTG